eukprot:scaffold117028_cov60-Phaeocystis_antarctica.AAC.1
MGGWWRGGEVDLPLGRPQLDGALLRRGEEPTAVEAQRAQRLAALAPAPVHVVLDQPLVLALVPPRRDRDLRAAHRRAHGRRWRRLLGRRTEDRLVLPCPERRRERGGGQHVARARGSGQLARAAVLEDRRPEVVRQLGRPAALLRRA